MKDPAKLISSAIIVMAAAILIAVGAQVRHGDTQLFVMILGCGVGLMGFGGWISAYRADVNSHSEKD